MIWLYFTVRVYCLKNTLWKTIKLPPFLSSKSKVYFDKVPDMDITSTYWVQGVVDYEDGIDDSYDNHENCESVVYH